MLRVGQFIFLILLVSVGLRADEFVSVAVGTRSAGSYGGSGVRFEAKLDLTLTNASEYEDMITLDFGYLGTVLGGSGGSSSGSVPSDIFTVLHPDEVETQTFSFYVFIRGLDWGEGVTSMDFESKMRLTLTSQVMGDLGTYHFVLKGTAHKGAPDGEGIVFGTPQLSLDLVNTLPKRQIWYDFALANFRDEPKTVTLSYLADGLSEQVAEFEVAAGTHGEATESLHRGALAVPADAAMLFYPEGILMSGVDTWTESMGFDPWEAAIVFPGGEVEEMRVRLDVDVFAEEDFDLVIRDGFGNEVDRINVVEGVYSSGIDVAFQGWAGQEVGLSIEGAEGYGVTTLSGSTTLGSGMNVLGLQIHRTDDPIQTVGVQTNPVVNADGTTTGSQTTRVLQNGAGTLTSTVNPDRPWNPDNRFGVNYTFAPTMDGGQVLQAIDSAVGAAAANGVSVSNMEGAEDGVNSALGGAGEGFGSGLAALPMPSGVGPGQEDEWVIEVPTMGGLQLPSIVVPLGHPAVFWLRTLMMVLVYWMWLGKTIALFKI